MQSNPTTYVMKKHRLIPHFLDRTFFKKENQHARRARVARNTALAGTFAEDTFCNYLSKTFMDSPCPHKNYPKSHMFYGVGLELSTLLVWGVRLHMNVSATLPRMVMYASQLKVFQENFCRVQSTVEP